MGWDEVGVSPKVWSRLPGPFATAYVALDATAPESGLLPLSCR